MRKELYMEKIISIEKNKTIFIFILVILSPKYTFRNILVVDSNYVIYNYFPVEPNPPAPRSESGSSSTSSN